MSGAVLLGAQGGRARSVGSGGLGEVRAVSSLWCVHSSWTEGRGRSQVDGRKGWVDRLWVCPGQRGGVSCVLDSWKLIVNVLC